MHRRIELSTGVSFALLIVMLAASLIGAHMSYRGIEIAWRKHLRTLLGSAARPKSADANIAGRTAGA